MVQALLWLLRFRNTHPAFAGACSVAGAGHQELTLTWRHGDEVARLDVDLARMRAVVTGSGTWADAGGAAAWQSTMESTR